MEQWENNEEIKIFREYLRIASVHPDVDYDPCLSFIVKQGKDLGLSISILHPADPKKPIVLLTWPGTDPTLPSILLNSHMDVVPVCEDKWTYPPFDAHIDASGRIYARGSQDMKCVATQYLGAIRALLKDDVRLRRTIHVCFVPDEEIGGLTGTKAFLETEHFRQLNVGFALDEGYANESDAYFAIYGERTVVRTKFTCTGDSGHGSLLLENTAAEKLQYIINKFMDYRGGQLKRLKENPELTIGDVTTVNLTIINGGIQGNIVPSDISAVFDNRLALDVKPEDFLEMVKAWANEAGSDVKLDILEQHPWTPPTILDDSNLYWVTFKKFFDEKNLAVKTIICPARGDLVYYRQLGIPALGFSPMKLMECRMHGNDEYLEAEVYLNGIQVYEGLLKRLGNI